MLKIILILVICSISLSDACKCAHSEGWEKTAYCASKFAAIIEVTSKVSNCGTKNHCYSINVIDQLRGPSISPNVLTTASDSAACGVTLTKGQTYFVTADPTADPKTIILNSCQVYIDWTDSTHYEVKQKTKKFQQIKCGDEPSEPKPEPENCAAKFIIDLMDRATSEIINYMKKCNSRSCGSCGHCKDDSCGHCKEDSCGHRKDD